MEEEKMLIKIFRERYKKMLLTKSEAASELSISEDTLDELRKDGVLKSKTVRGQIRFKIYEIARYIVDDF